MSRLVFIIVMIIFTLLSAFFSMSEISFSSADKFKLKSNYEKNKKKYALPMHISENFEETISTILVGNNLVNIAASSIATLFFVKEFGEAKGTTIATISVTLIILIFGEILPKLIGSSRSNSLIYVLSLPLRIFEILFFVITWPVNKLLNAFKKEDSEEDPSLTEDELVDIVEQIEETGEIDEDKSELIKKAIEFKDTTAYDVMVHRTNVVAFDISHDKKEFLTNKELLKYSYIPVYEGTIDNIIGLVSTKQVIKLFIKKSKFTIRSILRDAIFVNETKLINDIFKEMYHTRTKIVVVVDEFGGTFGILTKEDILEELVGEIFDEKDKVEYDYKEINNNEFIVDGDMNIYDMFELVDIDSSNFESEYATVAGWCSEILDGIPDKNDEFTYKNLKVKILKSDETTVEKIKITKENIEISNEDVDL